MLAYLSLHAHAPDFQLDGEVSYLGYQRIAIEFESPYMVKPINAIFAPITEDSDQCVTYVAVGSSASGQGEIYMRCPVAPHIHLRDEPERRTSEFWRANGIPEQHIETYIRAHGYRAPTVSIANTNASTLIIPENLNPIARVAHMLVYANLLRPEDLHPKLYEAINEALQSAGVTVIPVTRSGAGTLEVKREFFAIGQWGNA